MLKALELVGFKSFADKTRFEFPRGITVVVGPNGSGKSNVVDAIKWVLGEQSVKSLRGKEMVDVIFNGSAARRPLNSAETTLIFDNSDNRLPLDTPEVHVTRRVYRSGEGEYLINRQACRLRDIRDLFAGTGVATEAYSVIEQGKVDVLLQASPRDRRVIFEEAAGISRFKAKKLEALRRLERVEQNLLRLSDIVDEVENRLRSVRLQAGKARRYKEYADRLQELRTFVGLVDWRALESRRSEVETECAAIRQEIAAASSAIEAINARQADLERNIAQVEEQIHTREARIAHNRERVAALESFIEHERARCRDLEEEAARRRRQLASMNIRAGDVAGQLEITVAAAAETDRLRQELGARLAEEERAVTALMFQLDQIRQENEQRRQNQLERLQSAAALENERVALETQLARARAEQEKCAGRLKELAAQHEAARAAADQLADEQQQLAGRLDERAAALQRARESASELGRQLVQRQAEWSSWRERLSAAQERAAVLTEWENRLEGVGAGVKDLLDRLGPEPTKRGALGLLADLVQADVQMAPLVELALGEHAAHLVVADETALQAILATVGTRVVGRVGFLLLDTLPSVRTIAGGVDFSGRPGVVGRASQFVETGSECQSLVDRLLGHVWLVERLQDAWPLWHSAAGRVAVVTAAGDLLSVDGTLTIGPHQSSLGLISRRSELRALRTQIVQWERHAADQAAEVAELQGKIVAADRRVGDLTQRYQQAAEALAEHKLRVAAARQRCLQLVEQQQGVEQDAQLAAAQAVAVASELAVARGRLEQIQAALAQIEIRLTENCRRVEQLEAAHQQRQRAAMTVKLELARCEQHAEHLRLQLRRYEQDREERDKAIAEGRQQLAEALARIALGEQRLLEAEAELAELYLRKESFSHEAADLAAECEHLRAAKAAAANEAQRGQARVRRLEDRLHKRDLAAQEIRHEQTSLADRLREDYGIDLAALAEESTPEAQGDRQAVEEEIADLRRKLANIGGVNLDSLQEVEELEARFEALSSQLADLTKAKSSLEQIIGKINADSRRLFAETLETVKGHFQVLFRKLFGGGRADIVLEENVDILESGIEIVACPPGKEPRSISLLSGGEKTLTCVALLLAIFRSRPSPFCVLDEVDAALDEANIDRFIAVLNEFLQWTQFIVVTHSKKTMTCAHTLYGVTMQESGVSKRVSVRFEDVSEGGQIHPAAAAREEVASSDMAGLVDEESQAA